MSISVPYTAEDEHFVAFKQARRRDDDIAIVNSAFFFKLSAGGAIEASHPQAAGLTFYHKNRVLTGREDGFWRDGADDGHARQDDEGPRRQEVEQGDLRLGLRHSPGRPSPAAGSAGGHGPVPPRPHRQLPLQGLPRRQQVQRDASSAQRPRERHSGDTHLIHVEKEATESKLPISRSSRRNR